MSENMLAFTIENNMANASLTLLSQADDICEYLLQSEANGEDIRVMAYVPCIECFSVWNQTIDFDRQLRPEWNGSLCISSVLKGIPLNQLISQDDSNVLTVAVSDVKNRVEIKTGIHEENSTVAMKLLFRIPQKEGRYEAIIRIDRRRIPFYDVIYSIADWWEEKYPSAAIPEAARLPMYSSWYSFHQMLSTEELLKECWKAKRLGMETLILDDGWQTEDVQRGYAYCGDWKPAFSKVGNMKELVSGVHAIGMKVMLWYNIAFMGESADKVSDFQGMYMGPAIRSRYTFDPRYKKVRNYLASLFEDAVRDWDLDGVKIDFVDSFIRRDEDAIDREMDIPVLEEAVEELLKNIYERLRRIKPDILIEFRQNYTGPAMKRCANIFRVADCPNDALRNRMGVINLRLTSGKCAVHSDMLMWNQNEKVENAAKQIINILFSVPQISVRLDSLNKDHYQMLQFYISFWREHRDLLLDARMIPQDPEANYSAVSSETSEEEMIVCYSKNDVLLKGKKRYWLVNGTGTEKFYIELERGTECQVFDCMGNLVNTRKPDQGVLTLEIPVSGIARIQEVSTDLQKIREYHKSFRRQVEKNGNLLRDRRMPDLTEEAFSVYEKTGNRLIYENDYFERRRFLTVFGLLSSWYHKKEDIAKLEEIMEEICREKTWALPAHVNRKEPGWERMVDLFACETGHALALLLSQTEGFLNRELAQKVKEQIRYRVIDSYMEKPSWSWESFCNNWAAVCGGCIGSIALLLLEDDKQKQQTVLNRIYRILPNYLKGMMEDGTCPEGLGYYTYGMTYFVGFARHLYEHTNGTVNLLDHEKVRRIARFQQKCYLPGGCVVSFSDADRKGHYHLGLTCYLAEIAEGVEIPDISCAAEFNRDCDYSFMANWQNDVWIKEYLENAKDREKTEEWFSLLPDAQWAVWKKDRVGIALKGGNNGESHNHNDVGSFLMTADGEVFLADLGAGEYTKEYFSGEKRYGFLCTRSMGHSVPIVNGQEQKAGSEYAAESFISEKPGCVEISFAQAYEKQPSWKLCRKLESGKEEEKLTITDYIQGDGVRCLEENLITLIEPDVLEGKILLRGARGTVLVVLPEDCGPVYVLKEEYRNHQGRKEEVWSIRFAVPIVNGSGGCRMKCIYQHKKISLP